MDPSNVNANPKPAARARKLILEQHGTLRQRFADLKKMMAARDYQGLAKAMAPLRTEFLQHLKDEEEYVRPLLADLDAWGPARVDQMNEEHVRQTADIHTLVEIASRGQTSELLQALNTFIDEILADMKDEEKSMLSPEILRDDLVTDGSTGS